MSAGSDRNVSDPTEENSDNDWDAAEYVLSLREQGITHDSVSKVVSYTETLLKKRIARVKKNVTERLQPRGMCELIVSDSYDCVYIYKGV